MLSAYIESTEMQNQTEGIMTYLGFRAIETNKNYRVFMGEYDKNVFIFAEYLNLQFAGLSFHKEDSLFVTYTSFKEKYKPCLGILAIKRKGNDRLREHKITKQ